MCSLTELSWLCSATSQGDRLVKNQNTKLLEKIHPMSLAALFMKIGIMMPIRMASVESINLFPKQIELEVFDEARHFRKYKAQLSLELLNLFWITNRLLNKWTLGNRRKWPRYVCDRSGAASVQSLVTTKWIM